MFDPKCLELAEHFLPSWYTQEMKYALAQQIQDEVELFLYLLESGEEEVKNVPGKSE